MVDTKKGAESDLPADTTAEAGEGTDGESAVNGPAAEASAATGDPLARTDPSIVLADFAADEAGPRAPGAERSTPSPRPRAPPRAAAQGAASVDPSLNRYIDSLRLSELDLSAVELSAGRGPSLPALGASLLLAVIFGTAMAVLPSTALYQLHGTGEILFWLCGAGLVATLAFGLRHAGAMRQAPTFELPQGPDLSASRRRLARLSAQVEAFLARYGRALLLLCIAGLAALMVWVLPRDAEWQGGSYSSAWFMAVVAAMSCGVLVGRFILVQAEATPLREEVAPFVLPTWFRWVNLALLIAGGLVASFGASWFGLGGPGSGGEFSLAGLGLVVGIGGAIWLARRFDELEIKWREEAANKQAAQATEAPAQNGQMGKKP